MQTGSVRLVQLFAYRSMERGLHYSKQKVSKLLLQIPAKTAIKIPDEPFGFQNLESKLRMLNELIGIGCFIQRDFKILA